MTDIYKAAQQALHALEYRGTREFKVRQPAIEALRAALSAEHVEQPAEPVAYMHVPSIAMDGKVRPVLSFEKYEGDYTSGIYAERIPLYTTPQTAPDSEALHAEVEELKRALEMADLNYAGCMEDLEEAENREWVGLTDEEIEECMEMSIQKTCRAIEAKLKEKNGGGV